MALAAVTVSFLCHMFFLFSVPMFLIRPEAECNLGGYWHKCTKEDICGEDGQTKCLYRLNAVVEYNFVTEFGLYCEEAKSQVIGSLFFFGTTFSVLLVSGMGDYLGRIPLLLAAVLGNMLGVSLLMVFPSYEMSLFSSGIIGFFTMAGNGVSFNFIADSIPKKYKDIFPSLMNINWGLGEILISVVMWMGADWRTMCLIIFFFSSLFFIPLIWLRESPKFYFYAKRTHEAKKRLEHMAKVNMMEKIPRLRLIYPDYEIDKTTFLQKIKSMCCNKRMLIQILLVAILFSLGNMVFYAVSLNVENMGGNVYMNMILIAIAEVVSCLLSGPSLKFISEKLSISISYMVMTVGVFGLGFLWYNPIGSIILCVIAKIGATAIDNLLYTLSGFFFPTAIVGTSLGLALFATRFGNMLSQPIFLLGPFKMCMIMTGMGVVGSILPFFLKDRKFLEAEEEERRSTFSQDKSLLIT